MALCYKFVDGPFGEALVAERDQAVCWLSFADAGRANALGELALAFPNSELCESSVWLETIAPQLFERSGPDIAVSPDGTQFQRRVWNALLRIPTGSTCSYSELASILHCPRAARAVASAIAANRVGWLVPCHRVIRADGSPGGFRWGLVRKAQMLAFEGRQQSLAAAQVA